MNDVASCPTGIDKIVLSCPAQLGACDAAYPSMGGVAFIPVDGNNVVHILWSKPFPKSVETRLVSLSNPTGTRYRSFIHNVLERTTGTLSDNIANVYWLQKGATTVPGPLAHIICLQAHHQWFHCYVSLLDYIPGPANDIADFVCVR